MKRQKRVALINDVTGFGRCSIAVMLPILSVMKIQTVFVPTAILSANTYFDNYYFDDYTSKMPSYINTYKELELEFDGICSGFLGSKEQVGILIDFITHFKKDTTFVLVDPVMGDNGKLYPVYTPDMCQKVKELVRYADIITPNLTELTTLLDIPYPKEIPTHQELDNMCDRISALGPEKIVVTGLIKGNQILNFIYEKGKPTRIISVDRIGKDRSGTGDVFSGVIAGSYTNGLSFYESVQKAVSFVSKCIAYSESLDTPFNYGLCFEEYITEL